MRSDLKSAVGLIVRDMCSLVSEQRSSLLQYFMKWIISSRSA